MNNYLICGLGNPGEEYAHTRHNIGFDVVDKLADRWGTTWAKVRHGWMAEGKYRGRNAYLLKPDTYMNFSGKAVRHWLAELKIPHQNLLVVTDDIALPTGKLRLRGKGSDGGHNGLKSIQEALGTTEYPRLRFGVGNEYPKGGQVEYVLGRWEAGQQATVKERADVACEAVEAFVFNGMAQAMTKFNQ